MANFKPKTLIQDVKKQKPNYLTTIISTSIVLFLFGVFGLMLLNANALIRYFKENIEISIEIKNETPEIAIRDLQNRLGEQPYVKGGSIAFISKEEGATMMKDAFGDDFEQYGLENPLLDIIKFNVNAKDLTSQKLNDIKIELQKDTIVDNVFYEAIQVSSIENNVYRLGGIMLFVGVFFLIITFILINNTVRLALYSNRFLIKNMQLVGATDAFIAKPYWRRGVINGLIGSILAIIGLVLISWWFYQAFPELLLFQEFTYQLFLAIGLLVFGIGVSYLSTRWSVNQYLKLPVEALY